VTFKEGTTTLGTGTLATVSGVTSASLSLSTLAIGDHLITAVYSGDNNFSSTISTPLLQTVTPSLPTVTALSAGSGPADGGTAITITGTNFTYATAVYFGTTAASFTVNSATSITATAPTASAGTVDVQVVNAAGTSATSSADHYPFVPVPVVTGLNSLVGSTTGGAVVNITGTGFSGASLIYFGDIATGSFTVNSDSSITAIAPAETAGFVDVQVVTVGGISDVSFSQHRRCCKRKAGPRRNYTENCPADASRPACASTPEAAIS
jgi:hypothetical protein